MFQLYLVFIVCFVTMLVNGFKPTVSGKSYKVSPISMGFGDMLKKAMANDPNLTAAPNPGLSKAPEQVTIEFIKGTEFRKKVIALKGTSLRAAADAAKAPVRYQCKKGECRTCEVTFNGKVVKTCQSFIGLSTPKEVQVIIPANK